MTLRQIELVQQSFRLIQPIIDDAAILFYDRLFEIDPSLQPMFRRSRREQARLLAQTLTVVVKGIDRPSHFGAAWRRWGSVMPATECATSTMRRWARHSCGARDRVEGRIHVRGARRLGDGVWLAGVHDAAWRRPSRGCQSADRCRQRGVSRSFGSRSFGALPSAWLPPSGGRKLRYVPTCCGHMSGCPVSLKRCGAMLPFARGEDRISARVPIDQGQHSSLAT